MRDSDGVRICSLCGRTEARGERTVKAGYEGVLVCDRCLWEPIEGESPESDSPWDDPAAEAALTCLMGPGHAACFLRHSFTARGGLSVARVLADAQGAEAEGWPGAEEIEDWSDDGLCPEHIARYLRHGVRDPLEAHRRRRDEVRSKLGPVPEFVLRRKEDPVKPWGLSLNLDADWIGEGECCGGCFINPGLFGESYEAIPPDYGQVTRWATMILRDREGRQIRLRVPVVEVDDDHDEGKAWQATTNGYGIREDRVGEPEWLPEHCPVCGGDDLTADTLVRHASQITRDDPEAPLAYGLESVEVFSDETVMLDVSCDECGEVLWTRSKPITAP